MHWERFNASDGVFCSSWKHWEKFLCKWKKLVKVSLHKKSVSFGRIRSDLNEFFGKNYNVIYHYEKYYGLGAVINDNTGDITSYFMCRAPYNYPHRQRRIIASAFEFIVIGIFIERNRPIKHSKLIIILLWITIGRSGNARKYSICLFNTRLNRFAGKSSLY